LRAIGSSDSDLIARVDYARNLGLSLLDDGTGDAS